MTKKITHIIILILLVLSNNIWAQSEDDYTLLKQANQDYTAEKYQDAVDKYQKLVNAGNVSGELYYNLANSYYRVGNYKSAILYYERAKLLLPNDENIEYNLTESRKYVKDQIEAIPKFFLTGIADSVANIFSETTWSVLSIFTFVLFLVTVVIFLYSKSLILRKLSFYVGVLSILFAFFAFGGASWQYDKIHNRHYAIVFSPSVTVKSAPNQNGTELFIIHEGLKVEVKGNSNGWTEIKLADGRVGWLPNAAVEVI